MDRKSVGVLVLALAVFDLTGCSHPFKSQPSLSKIFGSQPSSSASAGAFGPTTAATAGGSLGQTESPTANPVSRFARRISESKLVTSVSSAFSPGLGSGGADEPADSLSLSRPARQGAELDVALAGILEQQGKISEAEEKLKSALKREPRSRKALTGYARFLDRRERHAEAIETYKRAVALHPNEASIHNDLALCHARHREFNESHEALSRAVALDGKSVRYRNNMAMICVEMGSLQEAYRHLEDAHGPAIAHYNLGHLLLQKGDLGGAAGAFARALEVNPGFTDAREMLAGLEGTGPADAYPGGGLASLPERRFSETFGSSDVSQRGTSRSTSPNVRRLPPVRYETAVPTP